MFAENRNLISRIWLDLLYSLTSGVSLGLLAFKCSSWRGVYTGSWCCWVIKVTCYTDPVLSKRAISCHMCLPCTGVSEVASAEAGVTFPFLSFSVIFNMCFWHCYLVLSTTIAHDYMFETKHVKQLSLRYFIVFRDYVCWVSWCEYVLSGGSSL